MATEKRERPEAYRRAAFKAAVPVSLPVAGGYFFLGLSYGIYMASLGFAPWVPFVLATVIYAGSLEFVLGGFLVSSFAPVSVFVVSFMVQARHLFYGLSMLDRFKGLGWKKHYSIFALTDETFAITYVRPAPEGIDKPWFQFWVSLLDHSYWMFSALLGGIIGANLPFDMTGIEFVMTAMFIAIFLDQSFKETKHWTALIGFAASIACLAMFGPDSFMIPTMVVVVLTLTVLRKPLEKEGGFAQ